MKKSLPCFLAVFICFTSLFAGTRLNNNTSSTENFFKELVKNNADVAKYTDPDELKISSRLGISYEGVKNKFLISYDIDVNIKEKIRQGSYHYELREKQLDKDYLKVEFFVPGINYSKDFYFRSGKYISPVSYFTRNWKRFSTRYFNFIIQDTSYFNNYAADQLEQFCEGMLSLLRINESEKQFLSANKIFYVLCSDSASIKKITGFNTRGLYLLSDDQIVTTYNCHFHELSHLLMNFRIKNIPLFTLPFLQEGFASAAGGRGGIARNVILNIGEFLQSSAYVPFNSILSYSDFSSEDASVTYPVAALYSTFLMNELGIEQYIDLYRSYSGNFDFVSNLKPEQIKLPSDDKFSIFLKRYKNREIIPDNNALKKTKIFSDSNSEIYDEKDYYLFHMKNYALIRSDENFPGYKSRVFSELFPDLTYTGYKYLITAEKERLKYIIFLQAT
ncbi:MAG: hypothetical protein ACM34K_18870 [Bacillota bacterium]